MYAAWNLVLIVVGLVINSADWSFFWVSQVGSIIGHGQFAYTVISLFLCTMGSVASGGD